MRKIMDVVGLCVIKENLIRSEEALLSTDSREHIIGIRTLHAVIAEIEVVLMDEIQKIEKRLPSKCGSRPDLPEIEQG